MKNPAASFFVKSGPLDTLFRQLCNGARAAIVQLPMLFSPFRRAAVVPVLLVLGVGDSATIARAAEFSSPALPASPSPFARESEEIPAAPIARFAPALRATRPTFAFRAARPDTAPFSERIAAPPDGFYQTPAELQPWLLELAKIRSRQVSTRILGRTPGGRLLLALEIRPLGVAPQKMKRLVVLCRQHGNEPESTASGARFIREFLSSSDPRKRRIAQKTALLIVPLANPDGAALYRRRTDLGIDMNRDWAAQKSPEVRLLARWVAASKPHLVVDVHQWLPNHHQPPPMAEASGGVLARQTARRMARSSAARGYALAARSRWGLDTLCHRYFGQRFKIPAILLETRHRPGVEGAREVAIATSLTALWSAAETLAR